MRQRLPSPYGQRIDRNRPVSAQFDGRDLPAFDGDSVASAIVATMAEATESPSNAGRSRPSNCADTGLLRSIRCPYGEGSL